jgi:hypothetical protein
MLLTITNTQPPATDLGYLLHKNPAHLQSFDLSFGRAHVFYPEATDESCTAALLLDVDPVGLVRNPRGPGGEGHALAERHANEEAEIEERISLNQQRVNAVVAALTQCGARPVVGGVDRSRRRGKVRQAV